MRVLVTGASGSGTTTLGRALSRKLKVTFFDVDLAKVPHAVTSGSVIQWGREIEDSFSLIVFLTLQAELRLSRLREREVARFGRADAKFLEEAAQYDEGHSEENSRIGDEKWLAERSCPVLRIEGDIPVQERVARVTNKLKRPIG
jgi:uridine kinase